MSKQRGDRVERPRGLAWLPAALPLLCLPLCACDPDRPEVPLPGEYTYDQCSNGIDDDDNGYTDCDDSSCWIFTFCGRVDADADADVDGTLDADVETLDDASEAEDAPDGEDGEDDVPLEPCLVEGQTQCVGGVWLGVCTLGFWEYFDCYHVCVDAGYAYAGCGECGSGFDQCCCT